jgi:hypothetical protein
MWDYDMGLVEVALDLQDVGAVHQSLSQLSPGDQANIASCILMNRASLLARRDGVLPLNSLSLL